MKVDVVNILFGDSIGYGIGDNEYFGWFNRIRNENKYKNDQIYFNLSIPGQSSKDILKRFKKEFLSRFNKNDIFNIIFSFGIKDTLKLNNNKYLNTFKSNVLKVIQIAKKYTNNIYFIGLIEIDNNIRLEYNIDSIKRINELLKDICQLKNIPFYNINEVINKSDLYDGLHPNSEGHKKICEYLEKNNFLKNNN